MTAVAFSPDGARVATASRDRSARVFDGGHRDRAGPARPRRPVNAVAFSPDGTRVATASSDDARRGCSRRPPGPSWPGSTTTAR